MKIQNLSEQLKREVKQLRSDLSEELQRLASHDKASQALNKRVTDLQDEITRLEAASPDDSAAIRLLGEKRTEQELLQRQIQASVKPEIHDESALKTQALNSLLVGPARSLLPKAIKPTFDHYLTTIAPAFRPFCSTSLEALTLAYGTAAAAFYGRMFCGGLGSAFGNPIPQARRVIGTCDAILNGELPSFDPQIEK